jgi:hypothetical protein
MSPRQLSECTVTKFELNIALSSYSSCKLSVSKTVCMLAVFSLTHILAWHYKTI